MNVIENRDVIRKFSAYNVNAGRYFATCMLQFMIILNKIYFKVNHFFIFYYIVVIDILDLKNSMWRLIQIRTLSYDM